MCDFELNYKSVEDKFNINFKEYFAQGLENLKAFESDGLATISDDGFKIKDMGRLLIRNIAINFDGYIERKEDKAKYSRTV
jgi:oxygen-independent coproporphyrinogen-3 oxidase